MCGRYTLYETEDLAQRFDVDTPEDDREDIAANYNVAPTQIMPVITDDTANRHLEFMQWGLVPRWAKDTKIGNRLINARSESAFAKPVWRHIIRTQRCLIPANGFYEWKNTATSQKQPFYVHTKAQPLFAFAGVWDSWQQPGGGILKTYSIMTTEPNKEISAIHNRMPVILYPEQEGAWIDPANDQPDDIAPLLHPYEDNGLELYPISQDVNSPANNTSALLQPLA